MSLVNTGACKCMTTPRCPQLLSKAAVGNRLPGVMEKDLPKCGLCDCTYTCSCESARYGPRACKHIHAVHALFYTIPAAKGEEPTVWLTGTSSDIVTDPANDDVMPAEGLVADSSPVGLVADSSPVGGVIVEEPAVVEEVVVETGATSSSSLADRTRALSSEMMSMTIKCCSRLRDLPLDEEDLQRYEAAFASNRTMYTEFGVKHGAEKWDEDPTFPKRACPADRHSHNMAHGRMNLKVRKPKKGRKI